MELKCLGRGTGQKLLGFEKEKVSLGSWSQETLPMGDKIMWPLKHALYLFDQLRAWKNTLNKENKSEQLFIDQDVHGNLREY